MNQIPDYNEWRAVLLGWVETHPRALHGAVTDLAVKVQRDGGVNVSPWTLRYHVTGKYSDVNLNLAKAVLEVIDAQS